MADERGMDSLLAIFAAPGAAAKAVDAIGNAVGAAGQQFADVLQALAPQDDESAVAADGSSVAESSALDDELGERLQQLLAAAGVEPGGCATLSYDSWTDSVEVDGASPLADDVATLIEGDAQLMEALRHMASEDADGDRVELLVQMP